MTHEERRPAAMLDLLYRRGLQLAFRLLYGELAWSYDMVSTLVSLGHWRDWATAGLPFLNGPCVLELGHGPGHMQIELAAAGFRATGIDLSPQMSRLTSRRLRQAEAPERLALARAQALPFRSETFDSILATFPAPYILAPATLQAAHRALRPGGRLVVVPEAELVSDGVPARAVEWLYSVTGQRRLATLDDGSESSYWQRVIEPWGFRVNVTRQPVVDSLVTIVVGERIEARSTA